MYCLSDVEREGLSKKENQNETDTVKETVITEKKEKKGKRVEHTTCISSVKNPSEIKLFQVFIDQSYKRSDNKTTF